MGLETDSTEPADPTPPETVGDVPSATTYRFTAQTIGEEAGPRATWSSRAVSGAIDASDAASARASLGSMGLRVVSLEPSAGGGRARGVRGSDFVAFNQQLAHLTQAGLPMEQGLALIAQDLKHGRLKQTIERVADELRAGKDLPEAFAAHRGAFPPLYGAILEAGIRTGNLPGVLMGLGQHLELLQRLRGAVWRAAAYPLVVLMGVLVMLGILGAVLVPQFREIFDDFDTQLPWVTELVFTLADVMPVLLIGLVVLGVGLGVLASVLRTAGKGQLLLDAILWVPLVGPAIRKNLLSRWCDALGLALKAGLDLPGALRLASGTVGSRPLSRDTESMVHALEQGQAIRRQTGLGFIPPAVPAAIELAAHADDLPGMLDNLSAMYQQQAEQRVAALHMVLGPLMLILVAGVIGLTIWALFMPLVQLMQSVM